MKITLKKEIEFFAPKGTKIIRNDDFLTLAYVSTDRDCIDIFTCEAEQIDDYDLDDELIWTTLTREELRKIVQIFKIKI